MIAVVIGLALATICFSGQCHPALIGQQTPTGVFPQGHARVLDPVYGGDVLAYARRSDGRPLAIHRAWLEQPKQRRLDRLRSTAVADPQDITAVASMSCRRSTSGWWTAARTGKWRSDDERNISK
jgi:hypothetical protein